MAFFQLRRILTEMLPSPAMMQQAGVLCMKSHLEEIRRLLWSINAVMADAELRVVLQKEPDLDGWVADVGATLVDLEDLLARIIDRQDEEAESGRSSAFLLPAARLAFRVAILRKLRKMRRELNGLVENGSAFNLWRELMDSMDPLEDGYSAILDDEVKGRRNEYEQIMDHLQQQYRQGEDEMDSPLTEECWRDDEIIEMDDAPFVMLICGDEGMGKRTLARMIYHDEWVRQHFHRRFWVDVSNLCCEDFVGIGSEIARSMGHGDTAEILLQTNNSDSIQGMWVSVDRQLAGRRYLLILDGFDLYSFDRLYDDLKWEDKWNELKRTLLRAGGPGSTVIITAGYYRYEEFIMQLDRMPENDWIELFMRWALAHRGVLGQEKRGDECMARAIAVQIYGTDQRICLVDPLSAKFMGSVFRYIEISRWQKIVDDHNDLGKIVEQQRKNLIKLYFHPSRHAHCVFYSSLFPDDDDDIFLSEEFMHLMVAEELLPLWNDKDVRLGYLRMVENKYGYTTRGAKTHKYCFTVDLGKEDSAVLPKQCRHLCLLLSSNASTASFPNMLAQFKRNKLRTLILRYSRENKNINAASKLQNCQILSIPKRMFAALTHLHTLSLRASTIQHLPRAIRKLRSLRYLNLSHTEIQTLPKSLCSLQNLLILNIAHCRNLEKLSRKIHRIKKLRILKLSYCEKLGMLPATFTRLTNLQELDLEGCPWLVQLPQGFNNLKRLAELNMHNCISLTQMPRGIGELADLLRLSGYHINGECGSALMELQNLVNLRELRLRRIEQALRSQEEFVGGFGLQKKTNLMYLTLHWQWWDEDLNSEAGVDPRASSQQRLELLEHDLDIQAGLHPADESLMEELVQQLEDLQPYQPCMKKLEIISYMGSRWPSWMLDILPFGSLTEMRLINLKRCKRLPPFGHLSNLKIVEISGMDSITTVDDFAYEEPIFSYLKELTFSEMPELKKMSMRSYRSNSFGELRLIHCPKFRELDTYKFDFTRLKLWMNSEMMFESAFNLSSFSELEIVGCRELEVLPKSMKNNFNKNLTSLIIISCSNLTCLPDWMGEAFSDLENLRICNCPALKSVPSIPTRRLKEIRMEGCPRLKLLDLSSIPAIPRKRRKITIQGCPKLHLPLNVPSYVDLQIMK